MKTRLMFYAVPEANPRRRVGVFGGSLSEARDNLARSLGCEVIDLAWRLHPAKVLEAEPEDIDDLGISVLDAFEMSASGGEGIRKHLAEIGTKGGKNFSRVAKIKNFRIETMSEPNKEIPEEVRKYMSELGKRGGKANKGSASRAEICRKAAQARWAKVKKAKGKKPKSSGKLTAKK